MMSSSKYSIGLHV